VDLLDLPDADRAAASAGLDEAVAGVSDLIRGGALLAPDGPAIEAAFLDLLL
jgi:hypothetical protein